ncbi:hypothetical protein CWB96_21605 [Pseudoalteromonas citrea]|uniref:Uncharacterized protein n=1 Tax=Pseudoalteromonas citrea TaxID=43655 RepID=A0A5S3XIU0_9GAMM|nr:hypothetical protein [Pseudoalteromonas citrea]TMP37418.1 hypothetical protein CWB97_22730 [Pseudoalteromonas citrea]TMP52686.1 hypothetical protein CWB96_21605 [Pseudoalteromonas citrea]
MKKSMLATIVAGGIVVLTYAAHSYASSDYFTYKIYGYYDSAGSQVGTYYQPCFGRMGKITGEKTSVKRLIESGTCR